ncbi:MULTISPECIES: S8 family serine peptidase [unclassified Isoptericola]|uniref:S8 family serine peptidase n=1 Tax=unclassified Isoptericola TaxID=2623355 RepID=UPI002713B2FE|nr:MULTISPECIES: S8 family serine peptidase [unclassified Isoptericola]MDO8143040.1 S8 family serine peptidase [Isoptericola sp. 178]MDO8146901.1 S8 family serine peptidase [Isoptericola sp. b515]MDO8150784.1 S8 family serine peptidase [Isoptericola sp. b408]
MRRRPVVGALAAFGLAATTVALPSIATANDPDGPEALAPVHTAPAGDEDTLVNETPGAWFVELESPPTAQGSSRAQVGREHSAFKDAAGAAGVDYTEREEFTSLFNGFSIDMDSSQLGRLQATKGVKAIYPMVQLSVPEPQTAAIPDMATALAMTGSDVAQNELGLTGAGVKVAVMDTGIDYAHPDFGGGEFPTERVAYGYDFVGDAYDAGSPDADARVPQPDGDPMDCQGHGTHVAGIVGADGDVVGVAPEVTFGAYRVFGCEGSTEADIMISAMEMALEDDMDILNMSIGSAFTWPSYPTASASNAMVDAGMIVAASIGNSGRSGVYSAGAPGVGEKVIGVASVDNTNTDAAKAVANPSGEPVAYTVLSTVAAPTAGETTDAMVHVGRGCVDTLGDTLLADPTGMTALVDRGSCTFEEKYASAVAAGATAVVIANNIPGLFNGGGVTDQGVPGVGISLADGDMLKAQMDAGETVTLTWTDETVSVVSPTGGEKSDFSSYGLAPDLSLKPDLAAPGGNIRSTYPLAKGGYATLSGTSMAAPHVAGAAALLLEADPEIAATEMRDLLQNTAEPILYAGAYVETVHGQGAGLIDVPAAYAATTSVTPAKISLGESVVDRVDGEPVFEPVTTTLTVANDSDAEVTYTMGHTTALATYGDTFAPTLSTIAGTAEFSDTEVTVPAGESAEVDVTITSPGFDGYQVLYGGFIEITGDDGSETSVPYAGFDGDYQDIEAITPIDLGDGEMVDVPWISRISECAEFVEFDCIDPMGSYSEAGGETFSLEWVDGLPDYPYVLAHFDHQVEDFTLTVIDSKDRVKGSFTVAADLGPLGRNESSTGVQAFVWDGTVTKARGNTTVTKDLKDGEYSLKIDALKANGDRSNPDHWETWTSPEFTIDRP